MKKTLSIFVLALCQLFASAQFSKETRSVLNLAFNDYGPEFNARPGFSSPDSATVNINNGKYSFVNKSGRDIWYVTSVNYSHTNDYEISVDAVHRNGVDGYGYGLYWGTNDGKTRYMYLIDAQGYYSFWKKSSYSTDLGNPIKWKQSSIISQEDNSNNHLSVKMYNSYWHFYVNDVMLDSTYADQYFTGDDVGVVVANRQQVDFDNLKLTQVGYKRVNQSGTLCTLVPFLEKTGKVKNEPIVADEKAPEYGAYASKTTVKVTDAKDAYVSSNYFYAVMGKYDDASQAQAKLDEVVNNLKKCLPNYYFRKKQKGFEPPTYYLHEKVGTGFKEYKMSVYATSKDNQYTVMFSSNYYNTENVYNPILNAPDKTSSELAKQVWKALESGKNNFEDLKNGEKDDNSSFKLTTYYKTKLSIDGANDGEIYKLIFTSMDYSMGEKLPKGTAEIILNDWRDKLKKILGNEFMIMNSESLTKDGLLDSKEYKFYTKEMDKYPISIKIYKSYSSDDQYYVKLSFNGNDWF